MKLFALSAIAGAILAVGAATQSATGQTGPPVCALHGTLTEYLREKFGESLRVRAIAEGGQILEFYVSPSGSWTMLVARRGAACVGGVGKDWTELPAADPGQPGI